LVDAVDHAAFTTDPHPARSDGWPMRWGAVRCSAGGSAVARTDVLIHQPGDRTGGG
jgi:hypothetical protein